MSFREYFEARFGIRPLYKQANQLRSFHGIPENNYELKNAFEHPYVSAMLQVKYGQSAPNLAKALGHSLEYWQQAVHDVPEWMKLNQPEGKDPKQPKDGWRDQKFWNRTKR